MGGKCCNHTSLHNIYDTLSYLESQELWLRQVIEQHNKKIRSESNISSNSNSLVLTSRKLKILSGISELSTFIKTMLDTHEGAIKNRYENELNESVQSLIQRYQLVKEMEFENNQYVEDLYARLKLYITTQGTLRNDREK